ncbi:U-box domain-containing protein 33-like isoform X2 [Syzygium oleosum]|uniref:U-box domain-containing protein 33-like isoform X2 n=1 Tax=Syzygium oleosum TaxID=219896 RepID=UPI0024BA6563|nr:U-box domain-containing protein 33-like isoform X2 [Syzygium oleosum]
MAVVNHIPTLPGFRIPAIMPCFHGVAPELTTPAFEDKIYVAPGKDVKEGKVKLVWTVHRSGGHVKICIIHVLVPSQTIPMRGLGAQIPASSANEIMLKEHREKERINMHKLLDTYVRVCEKMGVQAEKEYIESKSVETGIVELIRLHGIKKLVMGAAADKRYFSKMTEIKSKKAIFVHNEAHISCQIRFICNGHLIHTREARTVQAVAEVPTGAPLPTTRTHGTERSILSQSRSNALQSGTANLSNPIQDFFRRPFSSNVDRRAVMPTTSPCPDSTPSVQPNVVSMLERPDNFQEPEPVSTSLSHRPQLIQSVYHTGESSLSNTLKYPLCAEKLEEELEKMKDQLYKVMEEPHTAQEQKLRLDSQFAETYQSRKESELLQTDHDKARQKTKEMSRRQGDFSGTKYFSEFSMTEIKEAAQNFDPSMKIGEGSCGSVYKGFLRHTPVAIKKMKFCSLQGAQQFQQEVDVLSRVRHPNLITLIGACPEPWTLVYEYFPNGSLEDWLNSSNRAEQLSWRARIRIATELCSVLAFLHSWKPYSIIHGDVKPGNILLDTHLGSKLSDFGICRFLSSGERSSNNTTVLYTTDLSGTPGYMDPEFLVTQELTTKFDVYSFGIILLQLLTRRPAFRIAKEVQRAISAGTLEAILDPLAGEWPYMLAKELTHLGLRCCEMSRRNRPDLRSDVWMVLQSIGASCR